jgi:CRP-like cAMP-binding protein
MHYENGKNVTDFRMFGTGKLSRRWITYIQMLDSFAQIPLFQNLEPAQIDLLKPLFENFSCAAETLIFAQKTPAVYLYLILKGTILIQYKPYDGPPIIITRLSEGDVFGWSAAVGSPYYTSSAVSNSELKAFRIRGTALRNLVREHPETGQSILDLLAQFVSPRWKNAHTQVQSILENNLITEETMKEKRMETAKFESEQTQLRALLERLSAYVEQFHGGTVEFVSFDGENLKVRLGGACLDCPLQPSTLHGWVAGTVHQFFPNIKVVEEK